MQINYTVNQNAQSTAYIRVWANFLEASTNTVCHRYRQDASLDDDCPFFVTGLYSMRLLSCGNPGPITD
jgi:hypothetical protein